VIVNPRASDRGHFNDAPWFSEWKSVSQCGCLSDYELLRRHSTRKLLLKPAVVFGMLPLLLLLLYVQSMMNGMNDVRCLDSEIVH